MAKNINLFEAILIIMGGWGWFYQGLKKAKLRRKIADIPTSKISSVAIGSLVEVQGKILCAEEHQIVSPFTETKCAGFIWQLSENVGRGKYKTWVPLYTFYSTPYIYLTDDSEEIAAVDLSVCEFHEIPFTKNLYFSSSSTDIPEGVKKIFHEHGMLKLDTKPALQERKFQLGEMQFLPNEFIYVLGAASPMGQNEEPKKAHKMRKFGKRNSGIREKFTDLFRRLSKDPATVSLFDSDNNENLDEKEKKRLYDSLEKEILDEFKMSTWNDYHAKSKVLLTDPLIVDPFFPFDSLYVSKISEKKLQSRLRLSTLGLLFGPLAIAIGALYVIANFLMILHFFRSLI